MDHPAGQPTPLGFGVALEPVQEPIEQSPAAVLPDQPAVMPDDGEAAVQIPDEGPAGHGVLEAGEAPGDPADGPADFQQKFGRVRFDDGQRLALDVRDEPDEMPLAADRRYF